MYTMLVINGIETQNQRALLEHSPTKGNHVLPFVRHCQNLVISDNCNTINFAPCCSTLAGFTKHYIFSKFMTCVITVCQCCKTYDWKTENNLPHSEESNTPATNTNKQKQCFIHYSGASIAIENGNLSMQENLVMTSAYSRPYAPTDWQGGAKADSTREGKESLRHSACVCLGETLSSLPKGSQWSFSSKDLESLDCLPYDKDLWKTLFLAWSRF